MIEELEKYWYYAGEWHNAGCDFILHDRGICECDSKKIQKEIDTLLQEEKKEAVEEFAIYFEGTKFDIADAKMWLESEYGRKDK